MAGSAGICSYHPLVVTPTPICCAQESGWHLGLPHPQRRWRTRSAEAGELEHCTPRLPAAAHLGCASDCSFLAPSSAVLEMPCEGLRPAVLGPVSTSRQSHLVTTVLHCGWLEGVNAPALRRAWHRLDSHSFPMSLLPICPLIHWGVEA